MKDRIGRALVILLAGLAVALWPGCGSPQEWPDERPAPRPVRPAPPEPEPPPRRPRPCPGPGPCPRQAPAPVGARVNGPRLDGTEIQCDLPPDFHTRNTGGSDGLGLCVFCSMHHTGVWQNDPVFTGLFDWMKSKPGGGYPEKVDRMVADYCRDKGLSPPRYVQVEGGDLEVLKLACANGYMPGVTYSRSPTGRYGGRRISHMVSLVHADDTYFVILDNNYPRTYEWMSPDEFRKTYTGGRSGWAVILLSPGPPAPPRNEKE